LPHYLSWVDKIYVAANNPICTARSRMQRTSTSAAGDNAVKCGQLVNIHRANDRTQCIKKFDKHYQQKLLAV